MKHWIIGIAGGSGAPIAVQLLKHMSRIEGLKISLIISRYARDVFKAESGIHLDDNPGSWVKNLGINGGITCYSPEAMGADISSGSNQNDGMMIVPCSLSTLGAVASGVTHNLIQRCASVMLKEGRKLILVPRESPLSVIHLRNMLELSRCGADIVPPTLTFYTEPASLDDLVDSVCMKILDLAGLSHTVGKRWKG